MQLDALGLLESNVLSLVTGIGGNALYDAGKGIYKAGFARFWQAREARFDNETRLSLQRGVARAILRATLHHLEQIDAQQLADLDLHESGVYIPRPETRFQALTRLRRALLDGIGQLACPEDASCLTRRTKYYRQALARFPLNINGAQAREIAETLLIDAQGIQNDEVSDWQSFSHTSGKALSEAIVGLTLHLGQWPDRRVEAVTGVLSVRLFATEQHWYHTYALCFLEELTRDRALFSQLVSLQLLQANAGLDQITVAIGRLEAGLVAGLREIAAAAERTEESLTALIGQWQRDFQLDEQRVFASMAPGRHSAYGEMYFATERDKFIGREAVIDEIRDGFLAQSEDCPGFRWLVLMGEAGSGKSRLAFELINRCRMQWPVAGFVKAKFVIQAQMEAIDPGLIQAPTLLVIDYATRFVEQTLSLLERCAEMASALPHPIRVILIMRRPSEPFFNALRYGCDYGEVFDACFPPHDSVRSEDAGIIRLGELGDAEILALMRGRLGARGESLCDEILLEHLGYYDRRKRPLFAALVAEALNNDVLPGDPDGDSQEANRLRLFHEYLSRNYQNRWQYAGEQQRPGVASKRGLREVDKHITLALLATMVRGVTDSELDALQQRLPDAYQRLLPHRGAGLAQDGIELDESGILATILGTVRPTADDPYPPLEPDLLGESLVIHFLLEQAVGIHPPGTVLRERGRALLTRIAWLVNAEGAAYFAAMVAQDFPEHAERLNWLLPDDDALVTPFSRSLLLRNIVADIISQWRTQQINNLSLARLDKLLTLIRFDFEDPLLARKNTAEVLSQIAQHLGKLINQNLVLPGKSLSRLWQANELESMTMAADSGGDSSPATPPLSSMGAFVEASPPASSVRMEEALEDRFENSNQEVVQSAIHLLQSIVRLAFDRLWTEPDTSVREELITAVKLSLVSALWSGRDDYKIGGSAPHKLDQQERQLQQAVLSRCLQAGTADSSLTELSTAATLLTSLIYADQSLRLQSLAGVYQAISQRLSRELSANDYREGCNLLKFFNNYLALQLRALDALNSEAERGSARQEILATFSLARGIFDIIYSPTLTLALHRACVSHFSSCCVRVLSTPALFDDDSLARHAEECWQLLLPCLLNQQKCVISDSEVELFLCLWRLPQFAEDQLFNEQLAELMQRLDFDRPSLSVGPLSERGQLLRWLVFEFTGDSAVVLTKLITQVGGRIETDLAEIVLKQLPGRLVSEHRLAALLSVLPRLGAGPELQQQQIDACYLHLWSQYLLLDQPHRMAAAIYDHWPEGQQPDDYAARCLAFEGVRLLARWTSPIEPCVTRFLPHLARLVQAPDFQATRTPATLLPTAIHTHHLALIDLLADLVKIGASRGEAVDDYLTLKDRHYGN